MYNYEFHLDKWMPRIGARVHQWHYSGEIICGPCDLCNNEHLRRMLVDQIHWGPPILTDIFVMAKGEPDLRHVTKLGGLPHRPRDLPWPKTSYGNPMTFLGQFCFLDSLDLAGPIPNDILLIFLDSRNEIPEKLYFEWYPFGIPDLITAAEIPKQPYAFASCYGHICRVQNFSNALPDPFIRDEKVEICGMEVLSLYWIYQYQGTQIGTAPFYVQGNPGLPGRPLCSISTAVPADGVPFPWVNHADPIGEVEAPSIMKFLKQYLYFEDSGCIYINIDDNYGLHFVCQTS
jgi:hypothetical protein